MYWNEYEKGKKMFVYIVILNLSEIPNRAFFHHKTFMKFLLNWDKKDYNESCYIWIRGHTEFPTS